MFVDVKMTHLNARDDEEGWVELLAEFSQYGRDARLRMRLYGVREAPSGCEDDARKLVADVFTRGSAAPTISHHPVTGARVVVHGDDLLYLRQNGSRIEEDTSEDA